MSMLMVRELELVKQFRDMSLVCEETPNNVKLGTLKLANGILEEIREGRIIDLGLLVWLVLINQGKNQREWCDEIQIQGLCTICTRT